MRTSIYYCILVILLLLTFATIVGECRFVPKANRGRFGSAIQSRRWDRWCTEDYDCGHGFCRGNLCQCFSGYVTWHFMNVCAYEQQKKLVAFLLSFFVGMFGVDWFYLSRGNAGYIIAGIIKALISAGCCIIWPAIFINAQRKSRPRNRLYSFINIILTVMSLIWWAVDWIRILADVFYDGHGVPLQAWGRYNIYSKIPYIY